MTLWPDQPTGAGTPPQTRRQARESERTAARREGDEPAPVNEQPDADTQPGANAPAPWSEPPAIPPSAFAEPGVESPGRTAADGFDSLMFTVPGQPEEPEPPAESNFGLFKQAPSPSVVEPPTQPMTVVPTPAEIGPESGERTLTRREMRAMMQAQEANDTATQAPQTAEPVFPVSFTPDAPAESAQPQQPAPAPAPQKATWPFTAQESDVTVTPSAASAFTAFGSTPPTPPPTAERADAAPATPAPATPAPAGTPFADAPTEERRPFTPPTGHWSTAAEADDDEPVLTRNVGHSTAATTTNALILPSLPKPDVTSPLTSTGEILVTGSIDLPRSLGATGALPDRIDSSDIDRLLDGEENEFNTSEVAPVRASRAVSTHTSTRGVIAPPKKRGNTLPVVLMVTAGVLAVGVIGLLVATYLLNLF